MNEFLKAMKEDTNYGLTQNGGIKHLTTFNKVLDLFAMGGAMRERTDDDIILLFKEAYEEDATLALRCLMYLRDARQGQGERRFFRVCYKWLAKNDSKQAKNLIAHVATYGRYDDLFVLFDTPCERDMVDYIQHVVSDDSDPLVYKWLPSINTSSPVTREQGRKFARAFHMTEREYRKMLTEGRKKCHLVETMMSQDHWEDIDFAHVPSKAGLMYREAFSTNEKIKDRYAEFMANKETKVNAGVLNPVDIAHQIFRAYHPTAVDRDAWEKYWACLPDYYHGKEEPGIAVVDVSGSMYGLPLEAAVSLGAYVAERGKGPFHNHFITFSGAPELVEFTGVDIYDKFTRAEHANWGGNTNIEAVFDLLLDTALKHRTSAADMPKTLYIFSDFEFDRALTCGNPNPDTWSHVTPLNRNQIDTVIEAQARKWQAYGYEIPNIIFWNLNAMSRNIPAIGDKFRYVSGFSPVMIEQVLSGQGALEIMLSKLNSERYAAIEAIK